VFTGYVSFVDVFELYFVRCRPYGARSLCCTLPRDSPWAKISAAPSGAGASQKHDTAKFFKDRKGASSEGFAAKIRLLRPRFWFALNGAHQKLTLPPAFWMLDTLPGTMVILVSAGTKALIPQWDHGAGHTGWASSFGLEGLASSLTGLRIVSYDTQRWSAGLYYVTPLGLFALLASAKLSSAQTLNPIVCISTRVPRPALPR